MSFSSLWQLVKHSMKAEMKRGTRNSKRPHPLRNHPKSGTKLWLEILEDRNLLSVNWVNPAGGDWGTPGNWSTNALPGPNDDVVINLPGVTVSHSGGTDSVHSLTSTVPIVVSGGTLSLAADSTLTNTSAPDVLTLSSGTITSSGNLTVNGHFTWSGGTLTGGGSGSLTAQGGMLLTGTSANIDKVLDGMTLDNQGAAVFIYGNTLLVQNGATLINEATGTFDVGGGSVIEFNNVGALPTFINHGLLEHTATGTATLELPVISDGPVALHQGSLVLGFSNGPSHYTAPITADPGTSLTFPSGLQTIDASVSGDQITFGTRTYGGTFAVNGSYSATTSTTVSASVTFKGTVHSLGALAVGTSATLDLSGASIDAAALTLPSLFMVPGAALIGSGSATFVVSGAATLNGVLDGVHLTIATGQTAVFAAVYRAPDLQLLHGAVLENDGTILNPNDATISGDATSVFNNLGTFSKTGVTGTTWISVALNNSGTIDVQKGQLVIGNDSGLGPTTLVSSGTIHGALGTILGFEGPSTFTASSSINGDDVRFLSTGTTLSATVAGAYQAATRTYVINFNAAFTGTVYGFGDLVNAGNVDLTQATVVAPVSSLTMGFESTLSTGVNLTVTGLFLAVNTGTLSGTGTVYLNGAPRPAPMSSPA